MADISVHSDSELYVVHLAIEGDMTLRFIIDKENRRKLDHLLSGSYKVQHHRSNNRAIHLDTNITKWKHFSY